MKKDKIKEAIKINTKLVELGININSKDWEGFNFKLDEWGNLIIKSGKLDHKFFVSCKNEQLGNCEYYYLKEGDIIQEGDEFLYNNEWKKCKPNHNEIFTIVEWGGIRRKINKNEPLKNSEQLNEILYKLELTFENVKEFAKKMNFDLQKWSNGVNRQYYKLILDSEWGIYKEFNTLKEVVNYLSESK